MPLAASELARCANIIETPMLGRMRVNQAEAIKELIGQPIGRLGHPEEIAAVVLWPCSPGSSFVIDHALAVDGGYTTR